MISIDSVLEILGQYREFAIFISIIISVIIALLGVVPSIFVTGANIIFFGPIWGFIISLLGESIGGYISFKVYRLGLKKSITSILGKYRLVDNLVKSKGWKAGVLIFEGRLIPFIPSGFITLGAALSSVNSFIFVVTTFLGKIPSIALEALVSYEFINANEGSIKLIITIIALILLWLTIKKGNNS